MLKRTLILTGALLLVGTMAGGSIAAAQEYPPAPDSITVSDNTVTPNQQITVTSQTCEPGETVSFSFNGQPVGTAVANADGVASLDFRIPAGTAPGTYTVSSVCGAKQLSTTVTVSATATQGELPRTGQDGLGTLVRVGALLLATGGLVVLLARRRRPAAA